MVFLRPTYNRANVVRIHDGLFGIDMIPYTKKIFGVDVPVNWRNLNWNNRNRLLTADEKNKGWTAPRDHTRNAPKYSNGRHVPINTRIAVAETE